MELLLIISAIIIVFILGLFLINKKYSNDSKISESTILALRANYEKLQLEISEKESEINQINTSLSVTEATSNLLKEQNASQLKEINELKAKVDEFRETLTKEKILSSQHEQNAVSYKSTSLSKEKSIEEMKNEIENLKSLKVELATKLTNNEENEKKLQNEYSLKIRQYEQDLNNIKNDNKELTRQLASIREAEPIRIQEYNKKLSILTQSIEDQKEEEKRLRESKEAEVLMKLKELKETWSRHEKEVEDKMKLMCQQEGIEYIEKEKFPFYGRPDNSIKICDEYIIFDSKSPQGDDFSNFPIYIKTQAEQAKKYLKQSEVKKDIFFVVPTNSISVVKETFINLGNYNIHVITPESIRPILIQLKRIEEYEFAEQLSPEDRTQIAKIIGRMAHGMKRSVQISQFLNKEFISILLEAEKLPSEVLIESQAIEGKLKLNPPNESRNKSLKINTLVDESTNISAKLTGQDIYFGDDLSLIESLPLHIKEK